MGRAARRCALSVVLLTLPLALSASSARANEITGGCTGTVNGKDATLLTKDDPLVVHEGEQLAVSGNIPAEFAAANPPSSTTVKVSVIDGIFDISTDAQESTGAAYTAESVNVDDYFNVGVGLYRVDVVNTGLTWRCEYTGYIKLDGDPLSKPAGLVALAAVVIGAIGVMFSKGRKPREPGWIDTEGMRQYGDDLDELAKLVPMRRLGSSEEVADTIAFLASPQARYITGQTIVIDGGIDNTSTSQPGITS
jgi:hypothetical protein